jgi:hypothetical protein
MAATDRRAFGRIHRRGLGRTRGRAIIRSAGIARYGRVRRLPGRIHPKTRARQAARGRAVVRRRARARVVPPTPRPPDDVDPGLRLRRMGRLAALRGRRAAPATSASARRLVARRIRGCAPTDHVLRRHATGVGQRLRRKHAGVPSRWVSGYGACVRGGPAQCAAVRQNPYVVGVRRQRLACAPDCRREPPGSPPRLDARRHPRRGSHLQHRSS